jgi:hypothetical protein
MIEYKAIKIITENLPSFFWNVYYGLPNSVKMLYLERFLKKWISKEELVDFLSHRNYYSKLEDYKKTEHYMIMYKVLKIDLEKYNWLLNRNVTSVQKELDRDIKIWQIERF